MRSRLELWRHGRHVSLAIFGALFVVAALAKALDPTGYMLALEAFRVTAPVTALPLGIAALALAWTVLELLAGMLLVYGGVARRAPATLALAGTLLALGLSIAYVALDAGAAARHVAVRNVGWLGGLVPLRLSWLVVAAQAYVTLALAAKLRVIGEGARPAT